MEVAPSLIYRMMDKYIPFLTSHMGGVAGITVKVISSPNMGGMDIELGVMTGCVLFTAQFCLGYKPTLVRYCLG